MRKTKYLRPGLLLVAGILLCNPFVSTLDVLPDCFAYLLIIWALRGAAELVPHFGDAITHAKKLLLITSIKAPSFFMVSAYVAGDDRQRVLFTLVAFSFTVLELIWHFSLWQELFAGLEYLAERHGVDAIMQKNANGKSLFTAAKNAVMIALPAKLIVAVLPEFSLLSTYESTGSVSTVLRDIASFRPIFTVFAVLIGLGFTVWFLVAYIPFFHSLVRDEQLHSLLGQVREETVTPLRGSDRMRMVKRAMWCLAGGMLFMVDVVLDGVNYLPDALGILLLFACALLLRPLEARLSTTAMVAALIVFPCSLATYVVRQMFFAEYSYEALGRIIEADRLYSLYEGLSALETVLVILLFVALCVLLFSLVKQETGYQADNVHNYSSHLSLHAALCRKAVILSVLASLGSVATTADVFLRRITERYKLGAADGAGEVLGGIILPVYGWFWLIVFAISAIAFLYTLHFANVMNQEVVHKYSLSE